MKADRLQQRLQGPLTGELVRLVADWILDRPLHRLIDVPFVVDQVMTGLEMASQGEQLEAWVKTQVHALRGQVPAGIRVKFRWSLFHPETWSASRPCS